MPPADVQLSRAITLDRRWSRVAVAEGKSFVYGPRLGSMYLLDDRQADDPLLTRVLGLGRFTPCRELPDPTARIVHDLSTLKGVPLVNGSWALRQAYRIFHVGRSVCPLHRMLRILGRVITLLPGPETSRSVADIGRTLHAIEQRLGWRDCYPRALVTTYLCLRNGYPCDVTVGVLSPTRMMHAWCSTEGLLPYEPLPEHYMYQPLMVISLVPRPHRP